MKTNINLKKLLSITGILTVSTPASLIVTGCGNNQTQQISEQQIVDAINKVTYTNEFTVKTNVDEINKTITANLIKSKLTDDIAKAFVNDSFKFNKITIDGKDLTANNLDKAGTINTEINYNYGKLTNQKTKLTIKLTISEQQIVDAINKVTYENEEIGFKTSVNDIPNKINANFIKEKLTKDIKNGFQDNLFKLNKIIKDDKDLTDEDLAIEQSFNAKINYNYGSIKNQNTNIKITIKITDKQVVNVLKEGLNKLPPDQRTISEPETVEAFTNRIRMIIPILAEIILKEQDWKDDIFEPDKLELHEMTVNGHALQDKDLQPNDIKELKITFSFTYGTVENDELTIKILKDY